MFIYFLLPMSRRNVAKKRPVAPDSVYQSRLVSLLISHLLKKGKKSLAARIFYDSMKHIADTTSQDPLEVLRQAILNITPKVEVKSRRIGGATLQVPLEVKSDRGTALALRWLLTAARNRSGRSMVTKLSAEIIDAANNTGGAIRKREETHRMAEANKAFAHFRF
jgi:small subunit ribosomal protein S7